jgi:LysM repeat protein
MGPFSLTAVALSLLGPPAPGACGDSYTAARHDTLYSIARRCGFGVGEIARANRIDPTRIAAGQRLILPRGDESRGLVYRFQHGDTLYSLARWARVDLRALLAANPCIDPRQIDPGQAIRLPPGAVPPEPARLRERAAPHAAPPPLPPHVRPPPSQDDGADDDDGKPDAGPESGDEEDEPEGL